MNYSEKIIMREDQKKEHEIFIDEELSGLLDLSGEAAGAETSPHWSSIYIPLGCTDIYSVVWTVDNPDNERLAFLDAGQLSKPFRLAQIFGKNKIEAAYSKVRTTKEGPKSSPDFDAFAMELVENCRAKGCYSGYREVSAGVWLAPDDENVLVVNSKTLKRSDGKPIGRMEGGRREIYKTGGDFGDPLATPPAETSAVREILRALRTWGWENRSDALLMLGWLACASYTGALKWRPHIYLTAEPGFGKSGLQRLIFNLKPKDDAEERGVLDGGTTEAGLRQKIKSKALALIIDEREVSDEKKDGAFDQLLTSASSGSTVAKGTANQFGREDDVAFSAFMTGVNPPARSAALASRCVVLTFDKRPCGGGSTLPSLLKNETSARKLQHPLFSRMLLAWPAYCKNLEEVRESLAQSGCDGRIQDTYGTLIAGAITMRFAKVLTRRWIDRIVKGFNLTKHIDASTRSAKADCLSHILEQNLRDEVDTGSALYPVRGPVAEVATKALFGDEPEKRAFIVALERVGLKPKMGSDGQILLFIANRHDQLSKLLTGTAWTKTYAQQLHRIEGVEKSDSVIRLCGRSTKGRWIPTGIFPEAWVPAAEAAEDKSPF